MDHIAIDLGARASQVCIRDEHGKIIHEKRALTASLPALFKQRCPSRVVLETCAEAFRVAEAATDCGHQVRIVPATLVRTLGVGSRRIKTDRRDAQILSEVSTRIDLPSVHIPRHRSRDMKSRLKAKDILVAARTAIVNSVRGYLRTIGVHVRASTPAFPMRVRQHLSERIPDFVAHQLASLDALNEQILALEKTLLRSAKQDELTRRLMTVPGVGPITALSFVSVVDDVERFKDAHALQAYLGLTPGEHSSADRQRRTAITKAGPAFLRRNLTQAAWSTRIRRKNDPMALWAERIAQRRGTMIATVALARKIAGVMFAIWRDGSTYSPIT